MTAPILSHPTEYAHIVRTPGVLGGEPRLDGHRIRVRDVVIARDVEGLPEQEIAAKLYPSLTTAEVYAALAYYEDHREEIDGFARAEAEYVENFPKDQPNLVRDLRPANGA